VGLAIGVGRGNQLVFAKATASGDSARAIRSRRARCFTCVGPSPLSRPRSCSWSERGKVALTRRGPLSPVFSSVRDLARTRILPSGQLLNHTSGMRDVTDYQWDIRDRWWLPRALRPGAQGQHASLGTGDQFRYQQHWASRFWRMSIAKVSGRRSRSTCAATSSCP